MTDDAATSLRLVQTCGACPEQYDVFHKDGEQIGYLRLRHGYFRAEYTPTGETVYSAQPKGDGLFETDEREFYLRSALEALKTRHQTELGLQDPHGGLFT
jgi:hypothetical protein